MSKRTEELASRLEQGVMQLTAFAESLTPYEWDMHVSQEDRSVGIVVHHVANMYPVEIELAQVIASGQPISGVTWGLVAEINANHAVEHAHPDRKETLRLLQQNSAAAALAIRNLTDEQLNTVVPNSLYADSPQSLQFWLEDHQVTHAYRHLAYIKAAVKDMLPAGVA